MISRWEKAAKKMVKVEKSQTEFGLVFWRVSFPSCSAEDGMTYAQFDSRKCARRAAQRRICSLTKILHRASKEAGF